MSILQTVSLIAGILGAGAMISGVVNRKIDKMERKQDKREEARMEEGVLIIRGLQAVGHLAEATALAQKHGKPNGEMETAFGYYNRFTDDMNAFLLKQNAARNHGRR